jgi:hypothetical protein
MLRKTLLAAALVVATVAGAALTPKEADAQVFYRSPRVSVRVGTPYYGGGYYAPYRSYYGYPSYGYYGGGYYNNYGYYGPRYYGRYWR